MTTVQTMLARYRRAGTARRGTECANNAGTDAGAPAPFPRLGGMGKSARPWSTIALLSALFAALALPGCNSNPDRLYPPHVLVAPYDDLSGPVLWAVVPLANESGTTIVDPLRLTDALTARLTETRGVTAVPANRTIGAMRALGLNEITSVADARALAAALGVDGVIAGSITAWDPYDPPKIGLTLALFAREGRLRTGDQWLDPVALEMAFTDENMLPEAIITQEPTTVLAGHLDSANHEILMEVRRYAEGRHDYDAALGWRRYLASMDLYTDFAAYWAVRGLLDQERLRLARLVSRQTTQVSRQ